LRLVVPWQTANGGKWPGAAQTFGKTLNAWKMMNTTITNYLKVGRLKRNCSQCLSGKLFGAAQMFGKEHMEFDECNDSVITCQLIEEKLFTNNASGKPWCDLRIHTHSEKKR
jgi:hypothetical protein